jgi:uncharacterized protein (TIGR00296 family)
MCFEALDAELNSRKPLSLDQIQSSWPAFVEARASASDLKPTSAASLAFSSDSSAQQSAGETDSVSSASSSLTAAPSSTPATSTSSLQLDHQPTPATSTPLFVTWNTIDPDDPEDPALRGCIGTFEAQPLAAGLPEYAVISALHDSRFPPISRSELPSLQAAVTLLTDFEEVDDPFDWDIGVHGVRLSFYDRGRRYGSTYLPDVASEQGWSKEETLFSLIRKAGWMGSRSRWRDLELRLTRYQGRKATAEYPVFAKWKSWQASNSK